MSISLPLARNLAAARGGEDAAQHLETITDGNGHTTTYTRDTLGRVTGVEYPDASSETVSYDANGWPTAFTDANGTTVETVYNSIGLPIYRTIDGAAGVEGASFEQISYDTLLRPATFVNDSHTAHIGYTTLDRVDTFDAWHPTSSTFNVAGDRTGVTYPDARSLALSVDDDGRLRTITDGSTEIATFDYLGEVMSKRSYANGFTLGVARDALFRTTGWSHQDAAEMEASARQSQCEDVAMQSCRVWDGSRFSGSYVITGSTGQTEEESQMTPRLRGRLRRS